MDTFGMLRWSPPRLSSASSLRFRITLLEDAARACRAELQRRPSRCQDPPPPQPAASLSSRMLLQLGHDEIRMLAHELCDPMQPMLAIDLGSAAKGLRVCRRKRCWLSSSSSARDSAHLLRLRA